MPWNIHIYSVVFLPKKRTPTVRYTMNDQHRTPTNPPTHPPTSYTGQHQPIYSSILCMSYHTYWFLPKKNQHLSTDALLATPVCCTAFVPREDNSRKEETITTVCIVRTRVERRSSSSSTHKTKRYIFYRNSILIQQHPWT